MARSRLKTARVLISLGYTGLLLLLFLDYPGVWGSGWAKVLSWIQFTPSLTGFLSISGGAFLGFALVLVLTLIFGRVYCSFLCPLGTLQDFIIRLKKGRKGRYRFPFLKPMPLLRYSFLILFALALLAGFMPLAGWLDPFSIFGRVASVLLRWPLALVHNTASEGLEAMGSYLLAPLAWPGFKAWVAGLVLSWFGLILFFSLRRGRDYCNSICPVGGLLGLISRFSIIRPLIESSSCNHCGACGRVCKAGCIDSPNQSIDLSRCVMCMNCLESCTQNAIRLGRSGAPRQVGVEGKGSRRSFLKQSAGIVMAVPAVTALADNRKPPPPATPPGSFNRQRFADQCTACHLCVSACPAHVIRPSVLEYGWSGILQPRMDFRASYCTFECNQCTLICPTGALLPLSLEQKKSTRIGRVQFDEKLCVVVTKGTACGACSEHCPTKAVQMVPYNGKLTIPELRPTICVGCGACEFACPVDPRAIWVDGLEWHETAQAPKVEEKLKPVPSGEEFPF